MQRHIYNLEFPSRCPSFEIFEYSFTRVDDYELRLRELQHLVGGHSEFRTVPTTGRHSITSTVYHSDPEPSAVLEWAGESSTALMDILLILSLFTGRDVFAAPIDEEETRGVLIRDPQVFPHGGILRLSIPYEGQPIEPEPYEYDIGFERSLNVTYELIRSDSWRDQYRGGYFLFLANQAFRRQSLEASFVQCWTIWEHIFSVHHDRWLSSSSIRNINSHEKISFILAEYGVLEVIDEGIRTRIRSLSRIRNRLVHIGRFPDHSNVYQDAVLFIRLTEWILSTILHLEPSNALNTRERLQEFLQG